MDNRFSLLRINWSGIVTIGLVIRQFIPLAARGIGFMAIMLVVTLLGDLTRLWTQSRELPNKWKDEIGIEELDSSFERPMFYLLRWSLFVLLLIGWVVLSFTTVWIIQHIL